MNISVTVTRIIGCVLLSGAGVCLALALSGYEKRRITVLDGYMTLIRYIRGQIDCFAKPLDVLLAEADPGVLAACRGYADAAPNEIALRPSPLRPAENLSLLIRDSKSYLGSETERLLCDFVRELGGSYRREQVSRCDYYLALLDEQRNRLADTLPLRVRTAGTLCVTAAVTAALLLW